MKLLILATLAVFATLIPRAQAERANPQLFRDVQFEPSLNEKCGFITKIVPKRVSHAVIIGLHTFVLTDVGIYRLEIGPQHQRIGKLIIHAKSGELTWLEARADGRSAVFATSDGHAFTADFLAQNPERTIQPR